MKFRPPTRWVIECEYPGRYHNSPSVWRVAGAIRAHGWREALERAEVIVGSGNVRVRPQEEMQP